MSIAALYTGVAYFGYTWSGRHPTGPPTAVSATSAAPAARTPPATPSTTVAPAAAHAHTHPTPATSAAPTTPTGKPSGPAAPKPGKVAITAPGPAGSMRGTGSDGVALTFDDGPDPINTPALLDALAENGVKATFCLVGKQAATYKAIVARMVTEGHTLCNHSWQHLYYLAELDDQHLIRDLQATNEAIRAAAPGVEVKYFRAPYGRFTPRLNAIAAKLGMASIYWDFDDHSYITDTYGTGEIMVEHMEAQLRENTRPGSIILSHEFLRPHTVIAYRRILPWLKENFRIIALDAPH